MLLLLFLVIICLTLFKFYLQSVFKDATKLQEKGVELLKKDHYSEESIKLRCEELEKMMTQFDKKQETRLQDLTQSKDVHICLEQVSNLLKYTVA